MTNSAPNIHCVNQKCNAPNPLNAQFCFHCGTPIVKRYLWSFSEQPQQENQIGELIGDRYLLKQDKVFLDTKPGLVPDFPEDITSEIASYLKLFPYRLYLPQIYGYIQQPDPIWLLEYSSISIDEQGELSNPKIFPRLDEMWHKSSALRQINWLYQITQLWQPLATEKVVSSLLNQELLRVNGSFIVLLELQSDLDSNPSLEHLGQLWLNWSQKCNDSISEIVEKIALCLIQGLIKDTDKILHILDKSLYQLTEDEFTRKYQIVTVSDPGGKRGNNEDCCYPPPETFQEAHDGIETLTIVCDGLGGQEGGEIASNLAIKILQEELTNSYQEITPNIENENENNSEKKLVTTADKIINAIAKANDEITHRNDAEKRRERARMGTTVVMNLALEHEIYIANVGDSRVYLINKQNCHQLTVDDDLASREVRLGYGFYRDMIKSPQTGALLQALGMEDSDHLHIHLQRFILDENCVLLLCSDGLSDFDRVEQYWRTKILPILYNRIDLKQAAKNLLNTGVEKNGHDNITIGLVYCQIKRKEEQPEKLLFWENLQKDIPDLPSPLETPKEVKKELKITLEKPVILPIIIGLIVIIFGVVGLTVFNANKQPSNPTPNSQ